MDVFCTTYTIRPTSPESKDIEGEMDDYIKALLSISTAAWRAGPSPGFCFAA